MNGERVSVEVQVVASRLLVAGVDRRKMFRGHRNDLRPSIVRSANGAGPTRQTDRLPRIHYRIVNISIPAIVLALFTVPFADHHHADHSFGHRLPSQQHLLQVRDRRYALQLDRLTSTRGDSRGPSRPATASQRNQAVQGGQDT